MRFTLEETRWDRYHDIIAMVYKPFMTTVVPMDRAGRIVIPKETRDAQGIAPGTKFLLIEGKDGSLWLQRLDPKELARRIHEELQGVDLAPLAASILGTLEIIRVEERFVLACTPYFAGKKRKDCVHAATCLQLGATLVSNDHDFDAIDRAGVIRRMTISEAVRRWLPRKR